MIDKVIIVISVNNLLFLFTDLAHVTAVPGGHGRGLGTAARVPNATVRETKTKIRTRTRIVKTRRTLLKRRRRTNLSHLPKKWRRK